VRVTLIQRRMPRRNIVRQYCSASRMMSAFRSAQNTHRPLPARRAADIQSLSTHGD
jgi:hypothetical protein